MQVINLLTEYHPKPIGLDMPNPRFSWALSFGIRGRYRSAYEIKVASDPDVLKTDYPDMWNSGMVNSKQSTHIFLFREASFKQ